MSSSFVIIAVIVSVIVIAVVVSPLRSKSAQVQPAKNKPSPQAAYQDTLMALRDLDFDHDLGVVADDDYGRLREELVARAAETMPRKKSAGKQPSGRKHRRGGNRKAAHASGRPADGQIPAAHANPSPTASHATEAHEGGYCPQCGRAHQPEHVFCGKCGARLSAA